MNHILLKTDVPEIITYLNSFERFDEGMENFRDIIANTEKNAALLVKYKRIVQEAKDEVRGTFGEIFSLGPAIAEANYKMHQISHSMQEMVLFVETHCWVNSTELLLDKARKLPSYLEKNPEKSLVQVLAQEYVEDPNIVIEKDDKKFRRNSLGGELGNKIQSNVEIWAEGNFDICRPKKSIFSFLKPKPEEKFSAYNNLGTTTLNEIIEIIREEKINPMQVIPV